MTARMLLVAAAIAIAPGVASAVQPPPPPPAATTKPPTHGQQPPAAPRTERRPGQPANVKVELTISDQRSGGPAVKKTITVLTADGMTGLIRSSAQYMNVGEVPLNVDALPDILEGGKVRLHLNVQYDLPPSEQALANLKTGTLTRTQIHESLGLILDSGKPIVAAQSADPVSDRQVTIEVTATILK
jgi:hypothetical protein